MSICCFHSPQSYAWEYGNLWNSRLSSLLVYTFLHLSVQQNLGVQSFLKCEVQNVKNILGKNGLCRTASNHTFYPSIYYNFLYIQFSSNENLRGLGFGSPSVSVYSNSRVIGTVYLRIFFLIFCFLLLLLLLKYTIITYHLFNKCWVCACAGSR